MKIMLLACWLFFLSSSAYALSPAPEHLGTQAGQLLAKAKSCGLSSESANIFKNNYKEALSYKEENKQIREATIQAFDDATAVEMPTNKDECNDVYNNLFSRQQLIDLIIKDHFRKNVK